MNTEQSEDGLVVRNRFYTARLIRAGGRIASLVPAGTDVELACYRCQAKPMLSGGMAGELESGHPGQMCGDDFREDVLPTDGKTVRVRYTYHGRPGFFIGWAMKQVKTFTFHDDSPAIDVEQSLWNAGETEFFEEFRIHHQVAPGADGMMLVSTSDGLQTIPAPQAGAHWIRQFTEGFAGIWRRADRVALLFFPAYDQVASFLFSTNKNLATVEWFHRPFSLGSHAAWTSSYRILPHRLDSLDALPVVLADAGLHVDIHRRDRRPQAAVVVTDGDTRTGDNLGRFARTISRHVAREMVFQTPRYENTVTLPNGATYQCAILTAPGAGMEVSLPDEGPVGIVADVACRFDGPGQSEAYLGCCDPEGKLFAVSAPARLNFWSPSATLELALDDLAGKTVRLLLFGDRCLWSRLVLTSPGIQKDLFASPRVYPEKRDWPVDNPQADARPNAICLYVSPSGDDAFSGQLPQPDPLGKDGPFATLQKAQETVRKLNKQGTSTKPIHVMVRAGTYELGKTLVFTHEDSGTAASPVVYCAYPGEQVVISGGRKLKAAWAEAGHGVFTCRVPGFSRKKPPFRQVFAAGRRVPRARVPRDGFFHFGALADTSRTQVCFSPEDLRGVLNLKLAELVLYYVWHETRYTIAHLDESKSVVTLDKPVSANMSPDRYYVENTPSGLDAPDSWYFDSERSVLHWHPAAGMEPGDTEVVVPRLRELVRFQGTARRPVRGIVLRGFTFAYSDWFDPDGGSQAASRIGSAIALEHAEGCRLQNNRVLNAGTYGIGLYQGCRGNVLAENEIAYAGAGGIRIGLTVKDETTRENAAIGNEVHDCGQVYPGAVGIWIGQSSGNRVLRNRLHHLPYTGISVGWTWGPAENTHKANRIEENTIEHVMQLLHDGSAIYLLGVSYGTTVMNNTICDVTGGSGIYLDEGSTGMRVSGNRIDRCECGLMLHGARDNLFEHNTIAGSKECLMRLANCQSYMADNRFRRNGFRSDNDAPLISAHGWTRRFVSESGENEFVHADGKPFRIEGVAGIASLDEWVAAGYESMRTPPTR